MENTAVVDRPFVGARVDRDLAERFERLAREHDRSVSAELRRAMRLALEREQETVEA